jgi:hypothetical protein
MDLYIHSTVRVHGVVLNEAEVQHLHYLQVPYRRGYFLSRIDTIGLPGLSLLCGVTELLHGISEV